jgi:predicted O-methyltransferase YrrM
LDHERLFPVEWANRRVRDRFGDSVQAGPFKGLTYPDWGMTHVDLFAPKLLGSFEVELHDAVEQAIADRPDQVVNVGAAEGYYAVGLAMRLPEARVVAFEAQERHHASLAAIAERNAVPSVEIRGLCSAETLREIVSPGALIVCDCDGCELELFDAETVPALASCTLLVEAHDLLVQGVTPTLRERFEATHTIEEVPTRPRYVDDFPQLGDIPLVTRQLAISEFRGGPMWWLVMLPRRT